MKKAITINKRRYTGREIAELMAANAPQTSGGYHVHIGNASLICNYLHLVGIYYERCNDNPELAEVLTVWDVSKSDRYTKWVSL